MKTSYRHWSSIFTRRYCNYTKHMCH